MKNLFQKLDKSLKLKNNIAIKKVSSINEGSEYAKNLLYALSFDKTLIFLSGGTSPKILYEKLSSEDILKAYGFAFVDERFGKKLHENSNENMIAKTKLINYIEQKKFSFYPLITKESSIEKTTDNYQKTIKKLFSLKHPTIAILGIGSDGHTAGILPNRSDFKNPIFDDNKSLVAFFRDKNVVNKERVTLTFKSIHKFDYNIILVFGKEKKDALSKMFMKGSKKEIPARIFLNPKVATKTIIITDQTV